MRPSILLLLCALSRGSAITTGIFASCTGPRAASIAHCNASLAPDERVAALLGQLSTDEKIALLSPTQTPFCACHTLANDKADLGVYRWLVEANSGVSAPCLSKGRCPTMFVGPLGVAAAFNRSAWEKKGDVIGRELRALANVAAGHYGEENFTLYDKATVGLTGFGPNVNLVKDPRYGRNSELAGEDPVLAGEYAKAFVRGVQKRKDGVLRSAAYLKHYTAYSVRHAASFPSPATRPRASNSTTSTFRSRPRTGPARCTPAATSSSSRAGTAVATIATS